MPDTIRDGTGSGYLVRINSDNQMVTRSTVVDQRLHSACDARYYELTSGQITLTDAVETGILYILNSHPTDSIIIDRIFIDTWTSTNGSGADGTWKYYRNATYTGGSVAIANNSNYGSTDVAIGTFVKSLTTIGGTLWYSGYITDKTALALDEGRIVLPPGASHGVSVAAPTGNTSMKISMNIAFYYFDEGLI